MAIEPELETRKLELTCSDPYAAIFLSRCIPEVRDFFFFFHPILLMRWWFLRSINKMNKVLSIVC